MFDNFSKIFTLENIAYLFEGLTTSLLIAVVAIIFGTIIGTFAAMGKLSDNKIAKGIAVTYIELVRGTPMLLQIMILFNGIPLLYTTITGSYLDVNELLIGMIAISFNSGAYAAELIRGAINSIDKGQVEAGKCLGMPKNLIMKKIVLPQAFKRIIPPLANEFIVLIKDSSLVSTIGVLELLTRAQVLTTQYYSVFLPLMGAAIFYLCATLTVSYFANKLEMRLAESD